MKSNKTEKLQNLTIEDIPPNLRLAFKDYPEGTLSPGLIKMLQNYACDPADEKRWNEINAFMERDLDAEDQARIQQ